MRTPRPILLASAAAAVLLAAACSGDVTAPGSPTIAGDETPEPTLSPFFVVAGRDTTGTDSVIGGYGSNPCGGLDYHEFEYEPDTGTEYVVCPDTTVDDPDPSPTPTPTRGN